MIRLTLSLLCNFRSVNSVEKTKKTHRLHVNLSLSDDKDGVAMLLALLDILVCGETSLRELDS